MKILLISLYIAILSTAAIAQSHKSEPFKYHVKVSKENMRLVEVKASIIMGDSFLRMNAYGVPPSVERGWAQFVDIKSIKDKDGDSVPYKWDSSKKQWDLQISKNSEVKLHYVVNLKHDEHDWNPAGGVDGRPTLFPNETLFWVTKGLFIVPVGDASKKSEISFEVPKDWTVSTAWVKTGDRKFVTDDLDVLSSNLLMLGKHKEKVIKYDNMSITIAVTPDFEHTSQLLENTLADVLPVYKKIFGELPTANYLICVSKNVFEDGEAYSNSFHQMFVDKDLEFRKITWANTLAHEMFHYWNGTYFLYSDDYSANYWFSEGFTEYYSNLTLIRAGIVSKDEYLSKLAFQFARFHNSQLFSNGSQPSLVKAGKEKVKNWQLIYGGGSSIAFILDVEIRRLTDGKKSLDNFMRALYTKYGKPQKAMTLESQIKELNNLTGKDFKPFFDKYVTGTEPYLPQILQAGENAGLAVAEYQGEFYLKQRPNVANSIFDSIIQNDK